LLILFTIINVMALWVMKVGKNQLLKFKQAKRSKNFDPSIY